VEKTASKSKLGRVFSGIQPSGSQVHIGNYLGAMRRFVRLSQQSETIVCIVDLHALTSVDKKEEIEQYSQSLAAAYLAIGLDPDKVVIFRQSDVPAVCELSWYLACQFPLGLLERAHSLKDARAKNEALNAGRMFYPILMASDILLYRGNSVPVGADQKQHIEMTREIAQRFNHRFGDVFPIPEPLIEEATGVIPGLDGRKMSKSYDNYIGLFEAPKRVRKKVMKIVTDSKAVEEAKDPDNCNVYALYKLFATDDECEKLAARYREGGMGYGEAKQELFEAMEREIAPLRESYDDWISRPDDLRDVLRSGAANARRIAEETMVEVREAIGVGRVL
jgi:tryptophanyl-tRNA synthetase